MFGSSLRVLSQCGQRAIKFYGCCLVTGGYIMLRGFECVVRCDVCGAFTNGCEDAMQGVGGGCHLGGLFAMGCRRGKMVGSQAFCGADFGHQAATFGKDYSVRPCSVTSIDQAGLASELGTRGYRLYKTANGLVVRRIHGLGSLGKGRD